MLWGRAKDGLRTQASDPGSELHHRMTDAIEAIGHRLGSDPRLQDRIERMVEAAARGLADQFHDELAGLVTGTIQRWNAEETSTQLELLLGRDLQYIRINGTVVGRCGRPGPARHRHGARLAPAGCPPQAIPRPPRLPRLQVGQRPIPARGGRACRD